MARRLSHYELLAPIGAGGMGEVYRARDPRLGREVAVKVLPDTFSADPDRLKRFEREARAVGALNHPNILAIHDLGTEGGTPFIVTELLDGQTLRDGLASGPLPLRKVLDYGIQIARGLAAAHEKSIVHRDLKPENLFVTRDGRVKILDFGLAKLTRPEGVSGPAGDSVASTESGMILGTAGYMAPEQVRGQAADARADLFALGCVLYEALSGKRAFQGDTAVDMMSAILNAEPLPLAALGVEVPAGLERILHHCLEKNPEDRFQSARDLAFALDALGPQTIVSAGDRRGSRGRLEARTVLIAATAAALALAFGFVAGERVARTPPTFQRLTFARGTIGRARFAPDGQTIVYAAAWDGMPMKLFAERLDNRQSTPLDLPEARLLSVSGNGEIALAVGPGGAPMLGPHARLARAPLGGGAPREIMDDVVDADWAPDGTLALARQISGRTRVEFPPGHLLLDSPNTINGLRVSPDGAHVALIELSSISDMSRAFVSVLDRRGGRHILTKPFAQIAGMAWRPHGSEVWFSAAPAGTSQHVYAVTLTGHMRLVQQAPGAITLHDIAADGRLLVTRDDYRYVTIGGDARTQVQRDLSWHESTSAADISEDGRRFVFTDYGEPAGPTFVVAMRGTDGSPAVSLGEGYAGGLSRDGKWVVAIRLAPRPHLTLLPTGTGDARDLPAGPITDLGWSDWLPDGRRVVFTGTEPGHRERCYVQDVAGGLPRVLVPEGFGAVWHGVSPDGRTMFVRSADSTYVWHLDGGQPTQLRGLPPGDRAARWTSDGRGAVVRHDGPGLAVHFGRVDFPTGRRTALCTLAPTDPAGVTAIFQAIFTPDGRSYVYCYQRMLSDLYLVSGQR